MSGHEISYNFIEDEPGSTVHKAFSVIEPDPCLMPIIFNSPHSGRIYPTSFIAASKLDAAQLRMSEDCYVDELFAPATALGAPLMAAHFPRAYLDVNREPYELDPTMFADALPDYVNIKSARVAGGLGTIARVVGDGQEIYRHKLEFQAAKARIEALHMPYHQRLKSLVETIHAQFGLSLLIDCHSMPSSKLPLDDQHKPDFIIGDKCGLSCAPQITSFLEQKLIAQGFSVTRNLPYAGGYITTHYGTPDNGRHALQIEINRALYMDEKNLAKHQGFEHIRQALSQIIQDLKHHWPDLITPYLAAAE